MGYVWYWMESGTGRDAYTRNYGPMETRLSEDKLDLGRFEKMI